MSKTYYDFTVGSQWLLQNHNRSWEDLNSYTWAPLTKVKVVFFLLNFLLGAGYVCGFFSSHALMLSRTGPAFLFHAYVLSVVLALLLSGFFYLFADFLSSRKFFCLTFFLIGVMVVGSWVVLKSNPTQAWIYIGVRSLFYALFICAALWFWLIASYFCSNIDSKVLFPYFVAAEFLGMMVGGLFLNLAAVKMHSINFILIWGVILICAPLILIRGVLRNRAPFGEQDDPALKETSSLHSSASVASPFRTALPTLVFLFWLAYSFFAYGTDYVFNLASLNKFQQEDSLTAFFGIVTFVANGATVAYHLFLSSRLLLRWSLAWLILGISLIIFLVWVGILFHPTLATIAVGQGIIFFFVESIAIAHLHTVLTLFPLLSRGRIRAMSEGFGRPLGCLLLFLLAAFFSFRLSTAEISNMMIVAALLFLFYPLLFRRVYHRHLLQCLKSKYPDLLFNAVQALGERGKRDAVAPLLSLLNEAKGVALQENIVLSLGRIQSRESLQDIVRLFSTTNATLQNRVLEALCYYNNPEAMVTLIKLIKFNPSISLQVRLNAAMVLTRLVGKRMIPFLLEALFNPEIRIVSNAIEALGILKDRTLIPALLPYLQHENHRVRTNTAIALYPFRSIRRQCLETIKELFHSEKEIEQRAALYAIGALKLKGYEPLLVPMLNSNNQNLQRLVCLALARMKNPSFVETFLNLLLDKEEQCVLETKKRLEQMPPSSRRWVLTGTASLLREQRELIYTRLFGMASSSREVLL